MTRVGSGGRVPNLSPVWFPPSLRFSFLSVPLASSFPQSSLFIPTSWGSCWFPVKMTGNSLFQSDRPSRRSVPWRGPLLFHCFWCSLNGVERLTSFSHRTLPTGPYVNLISICTPPNIVLLLSSTLLPRNDKCVVETYMYDRRHRECLGLLPPSLFVLLPLQKWMGFSESTGPIWTPSSGLGYKRVVRWDTSVVSGPKERNRDENNL